MQTLPMRRSRLWLTVMAAASAATALPASAAGFNGPAAPANFNVANVGTLVGASPSTGQAQFSATQLVLLGANTTSPNPANNVAGCSGGVYATLSSPCQVQAVLNVAGTYSFDWSYATADDAGPAGDIFGVVVNGARTVLSDPGGAIGQSGSASFVATSSFGWFINCTDCIGGRATATVSNFVLSPVPELPPAALLLAGGAGVGLARRWRLRKAG